MSNVIKYRSDIDGLRGVAIISVLLFHLNQNWLRGGFFGVDIFFVISGYLITKIIFREIQEDRFSFINFYSRRIKRIFPALLSMLFTTAIVAIICFPSSYFRSFFTSFSYAAGQISNFYFSHRVEYFDTESNMQPLLHTWSLGVEEQFYLIWPLIVFFCFKIKSFSKNRLSAALILIIIFSLWLNSPWSKIGERQAFFMLYTRAWELLFGSIIALDIMRSPKKKSLNTLIAILGFALVVYSMFFIKADTLLKFANLFPCVGAAMIIYSGQTYNSFVSRLLSIRPLVFTGLISYSLYLWHWPVIVIYKYLIGIDISAADYFIIIMISLALSILSYFFIEQKTRYVKSIPDKDVLALGAICITLFTVSGLALIHTSEAQWRVNGLKQQIEQRKLDEAFFDLPTMVNDPRIKYEAMVIGDSHAAAYFPAIYKYSKEHGLKAKLVNESGCANLIKKRNDELNNCANTKEEMLLDQNVRHVFIALRQDMYTETAAQKKSFTTNLEASIKYLKDHDKKIYLLGQVPVLKIDPNICSETTLLSRLSPEYRKNCLKLDFDYSDKRISYSDRLYKTLAKKYNLEYFNPALYFETITNKNGNTLYSDRNHINHSGARYLYPHIKFKNFP